MTRANRAPSSVIYVCGRVALFTPPARLARFLDATLAAGIDPDGTPSWNVTPQRTLFGMTEHGEGRSLDAYRWGLVPSWSKTSTTTTPLFNARSETVMEKPSFRSAFAQRPCVIPVDGFYEWDHRPETARRPHYFQRRDGQLLLLAGLVEEWRDPSTPDGPVLRTCAVLTTTPNADMDGMHERMPVVLESETVEPWLDITAARDLRHALCGPAATGTLEHYSVSSAVGNVRSDGPHLMERDEPNTLF